MSEKKKAYGVFLFEDGVETLIFIDALSYAIYERKAVAAAYRKEMAARRPRTTYTVKEMTIEVKANE